MDTSLALLLAAERRGLLSHDQVGRARAALDAAGSSCTAGGPEAIARFLIAQGFLAAAHLDSLLSEVGRIAPSGAATLVAPPIFVAGPDSEATLLRPPAPPDPVAPALATTPASATLPTAPDTLPTPATERTVVRPDSQSPALPPRATPDLPTASTPRAPQPGDHFPYVPREVLGQGGMGRVWSALDPALGREVAVKTILQAHDPGIRQRFIEEAQVTGQLEHPNIVPVHELGFHPERGPYLVMKRVRGRSLKAVLADVAERGSELRLRKSSRRSRRGEDGSATAPVASATTATCLRPDPAGAETGRAAPGGPLPSAGPGAATAAPAAAATTAKPESAADSDPSRVPADKALPWLLNAFVKVCEAMAYAHARGVIHRDLKPENIMVGEFGEVVVMDWGLAKLVGRPETRRERLVIAEAPAGAGGVMRTLDGEVIGTPMYMPPEQARGEVDALDGRSDLYSLGVILYEILALQQPFEGKDVYELLGHVRAGRFRPPHERTVAPWEVPRDLEAVALKAMAREPARRYARVLELKAEVEAYLSGRRLSAAEYSPWDLLLKWARRNKAAVATGSAAALLLLAATVLFVIYQRDARKAAEESARQANISAIESKVSQADAFLRAGDWNDAIKFFGQARDGYLKLQLPADVIDWGLTVAYRANSPSILDLNDWGRDIYAVAVSPDGRHLLVGGKDAAVLCELPTGRRIRTFAGEMDERNAIAFSPDSAIALVGGASGIATLWDVATGRVLHTLRGHTQPLAGAVFSPDGRQLLTSSRDSRILLWDVATGTVLRVMQANTSSNPGLRGLWGLSFTPDGRRALSASVDKVVRLWDLATGRLLWEARGHTDYPFQSHVLPDGLRALTCGFGNRVYLWDLEQGRLIESFEKPPQTFKTGGGAFLPGSRGRLLFVCTDAKLRLWEMGPQHPAREFQGHLGPAGAAGSFSAGRKAVSLGPKGDVRIWDLTQENDRPSIRVHQGEIAGVHVTADGRRALTAGKTDGTLRLWDLASGMEIRVLRGQQGAVWGCDMSRDGRRAVTGASDSTLRVWDLMTGREEKTLQTYWPTSVAISSDGRTAYSGGQDGVLRIFDLERGQRGREIDLFPVDPPRIRWIRSITLLPDGRHALITPCANDVKLYDLESGTMLRSWPGSGHTNAVVSPDGRSMALGELDQAVRIRDLATGETRSVFKDAAPSDASLGFTPDGRCLLSVAGDGILRRWSVASGRELINFRMGYGSVGFTFLPDGERAIGAENDSLSLWDFGAPARYREFERGLPEAQARLQKDPRDVAALLTMGRWFFFRRVWDWAAELMEQAGRAGGQVDPLALGACYWRLGRYEEARREYRRARDGAGTDAQLADHARLCLDGVELAAQRGHLRAALLKFAQPLALGHYEGRLDEASACDKGRRLKLYSVQAGAGERLKLTLTSREMTPTLVVLPPDGDTIVAPALANNPSVAECEVLVPEEGLCALECTSLRPRAAGAYVLEVSLVK